MPRNWDRLNRREFMGASVAGGALAAGVTLLSDPGSAAAAASRYLHVYAGAMSCAAGEPLPLHVSTNLKQFSVRVTRVGAQPGVVWQCDEAPGVEYPTPADAAMHGCRWPAALQVPVQKDWRSGVYRVELQGTGPEAGTASETFFIVRPNPSGSRAKILFQLATNTYQAYNGWGGGSLYSGPQHPRISFDRPIHIEPPQIGTPQGFYNPNLACYRTWDEPFIIWAEQSGYEVDYCANLDLELHPEILQHYRLVLSIGHDEYWSAGMRDQLEAFIANGGNAAFFSGNSVCWQIRVEDQGRALVCFKNAHEQDPAFTGDRRQLTTLWSDPLLKRPENQLTGVGFSYGGYNGFFGEYLTGPGAGEYTVHRPEHWLFAGTGLQAGEAFGRLPAGGPQPGIAGYECDGCEFIWRDGLPVPTGRDGTPQSFQILATAPARWSAVDGSVDWARNLRRSLPAAAQPLPEDFETRPGAAVLGVYERGGTVVTAGSCGWTYGLQARHPVVERMVRTVLDRLSA